MELINKILIATAILGWVIADVSLAVCRRKQARIDEENLNSAFPRRCRKPCVQNSDCKGQLKRCSCDGICGMSCFNKDAVCPDLPQPADPHLRLEYLGGRHNWGSQVEYSCTEGFALNETTSRRTCRSDRKYSGREPSCERGCQRPTAIGPAYPNTPIVKNGYRIGDTVQYLCRLGYVSVHPGEVWSTCDRNGENAVWRRPPDEMCNKVKCPYPIVPTNGRVDAQDISFASTIHYSCNPGYVLEGSNTRRCFSNREWSGEPPRCEAIQCDGPVPPTNGYVEDYGIEYEFGAMIGVRCDVGFRLVGDRTMRCSEEGSWEGNTTCQVDLSCDFETLRRPTCNYEMVAIERWSRMFKPSWTGLSSHILQVHISSERPGVLKSQEFINWSGLKCLQFHYLLDSRDASLTVGSIGAQWARPNSDKDRQWYGGEVSVPSANSSSSINITASTKSKLLTLQLDDIVLVNQPCENDCESSPCQNGGTCVDRIRSFECICDSFHIGEICERESCRTPQRLADGILMRRSDGSPVGPNTLVKIGEIIVFGCSNENKKVEGTNTMECRDDGTWDTQSLPLSCTVYRCPPLAVDGNVQVRHCASWGWYRCSRWVSIRAQDGSANPTYRLIQNKVKFVCQAWGQTVHGSEYATCLATGVWSSTPPTCLQDVCSSINCGNGQCVPEHDTYRCDCHHGFIGDRCQNVDRVDQIMYNGTMINFYHVPKSQDEARRFCEAESSELISVKSRDLQDKLTAYISTHEVVKSDFNPCNGVYDYGFWTSGNKISGQNSWQWGDGTSISQPQSSDFQNWVGVEPNDGALVGLQLFSEPVYLLDDIRNAYGKWLDNPAKHAKYFICQKAIQCGRPVSPTNGYVEDSVLGVRFEFGAVVDVRCDVGFRLVGDRSMRCGEEGSWEGNTTCQDVCSSINCGNRQCVPERDTYRCDCRHGFNGDRCQNEIKCKIEKKYLNEGVHIVTEQMYTSLNFSYNDTVVLQCEEGYSLQDSRLSRQDGEITLTCGNNGEWNENYSAYTCEFPN